MVSFSDAHSLPNVGRELTVFEGEPGYLHLASGLKTYNVEQTLSCSLKKGNTVSQGTAGAE